MGGGLRQWVLWVGSRGREYKAPEKLLNEMDTHGVCMKVNTHQIVPLTCVWFMLCHFYLSHAVISV